MKWDFVEASGRGTVASYTVIHHPKFPGYDYPIIVVLVDLEEGTRIISQLMECETDAVRFGMDVEVKIHQDEDGFKLPVFVPAQKGV